MNTAEISLDCLYISPFERYRGRLINKRRYKLIENDVFDIGRQLREINPGYFILYNTETGKYEVHNSENKGMTYCLTVPYDELDSRTITVVLKTRAANARQLIREMEEHNAKLERDHRNKFRDEVGEIAKDIYDYGQRSGDETRLDAKAKEWAK